MDWEGRVLLLAIVADPLLLPLNLTLPVSLLQEVRAICASIRSISLHQAFNVPTTASPFRQLCQLPRHHVPDGIPRRCWAEGNNMENMDAYCAMTILWHV